MQSNIFLSLFASLFFFTNGLVSPMYAYDQDIVCDNAMSATDTAVAQAIINKLYDQDYADRLVKSAGSHPMAQGLADQSRRNLLYTLENSLYCRGDTDTYVQSMADIKNAIAVYAKDVIASKKTVEDLIKSRFPQADQQIISLQNHIVSDLVDQTNISPIYGYDGLLGIDITVNEIEPLGFDTLRAKIGYIFKGANDTINNQGQVSYTINVSLSANQAGEMGQSTPISVDIEISIDASFTENTAYITLKNVSIKNIQIGSLSDEITTQFGQTMPEFIDKIEKFLNQTLATKSIAIPLDQLDQQTLELDPRELLPSAILSKLQHIQKNPLLLFLHQEAGSYFAIPHPNFCNIMGTFDQYLANECYDVLIEMYNDTDKKGFIRVDTQNGISSLYFDPRFIDEEILGDGSPLFSGTPLIRRDANTILAISIQDQQKNTFIDYQNGVLTMQMLAQPEFSTEGFYRAGSVKKGHILGSGKLSIDNMIMHIDTDIQIAGSSKIGGEMRMSMQQDNQNIGNMTINFSSQRQSITNIQMPIITNTYSPEQIGELINEGIRTLFPLRAMSEKDTNTERFSRDIQSALTSYYTDNGEYPASDTFVSIGDMRETIDSYMWRPSQDQNMLYDSILYKSYTKNGVANAGYIILAPMHLYGQYRETSTRPLMKSESNIVYRSTLANREIIQANTVAKTDEQLLAEFGNQSYRYILIE